MDLIQQAGSASNHRTVRQIPGLSTAEREQLKACMDTVCQKHLNPRKLWHEQSDDAKAALKREATKDFKALLRYADQWPVESLARHILCNARAKLKQYRRASARRADDWAYVMTRRRVGRPRRASQPASAPAADQLEDANDVESEDETIQASSAEEPAIERRSPSAEVLNTVQRRPQRPSARLPGLRSGHIIDSPEQNELMYPEDDDTNINKGAPVGADDNSSKLPVANVAMSHLKDKNTNLIESSAAVHGSALKRQRRLLSLSQEDSTFPKRVRDGPSRAGPSVTRLKTEQDEGGPSGTPPDTPTGVGIAQQSERYQHTPASPIPSKDPEDNSFVKAGPSDPPAPTYPVAMRNPTSPPPSHHSDILMFLRDISPVLATSDAVRRFAAAGVVTREDLGVFALLSKEGQLEMLRGDVGLSIVQAKVVREALGKM